MEANASTDASRFRTGLHHYTTPSTRLTRIVARLVRGVLSGAARLKFLGAIDLERISVYSTEKLLNLPGQLPFFPTKTTELARVRDLFERLRPKKSGYELVRFGPDGDGGYWLPSDLDAIEACFSPGVGNVVGFEKDCAEKGMKVFLADASVERPPETHPNFHFLKKFIGSISQGSFLSLGDWVSSSLPDSEADLLLQIDIEGYEYETLLSTPANVLQRFRIIAIEFHNLDCLFSEPIFDLYSKAFEKLLHTHTCVHMQQNTICNSIKVRGLEIPELAEFTFLRNDRVAIAAA